MKWITINKLSELTGYSENAIRTKIKKGVRLMEKPQKNGSCPPEIGSKH